MDHQVLITALWITLAGMGIVFGTILALWGLMIALTSLLKEKEKKYQTGTSPLPFPSAEEESRAKAAALAVTVALAAQDLSTAHPLNTPPTALVSAWQLGMRTRQMYQKGERVKSERKELRVLNRGTRK